MTTVMTPPAEQTTNKTNRIALRKENGKTAILEKTMEGNTSEFGHGHGHEHAELYWGERTSFECDREAMDPWVPVLFQIGALHLASTEELERLSQADEGMAGVDFETTGPDSPFALSGGKNWIDRSFDWTLLVEAGEERAIVSPRVDSAVIEDGKHYCYKFTWKVKSGREDVTWDPHIIVHGGPPLT